MQTICIDFNSSTRVAVYAECIYVFLSKSCSHHWIPCWLLTNITVTSAVTKFSVPQIDGKIKQVKVQLYEKFYVQSPRGKTRYFKHRKYQNLWMNNKVRGNKNAICLHFLRYLLNICKKLKFLISQGSVATGLRWGGSCCMGLVANFMRFPSVQKFWQSVKVWQSYREFKGGNIFWGTVYYYYYDWPVKELDRWLCYFHECWV